MVGCIVDHTVPRASHVGGYQMMLRGVVLDARLSFLKAVAEGPPTTITLGPLWQYLHPHHWNHHGQAGDVGRGKAGTDMATHMGQFRMGFP